MMRILLVEDSKLLRDSITEMLSGCQNLSVDAYASNSHDAISLLRNNKFDLIIADIELTEGNGFDVVKFTDSKEYPYDKPVTVMLTNHSNSYYKNLAKQLGVKYFYDKSMDFETAIDTIESEAKKFQ